MFRKKEMIAMLLAGGQGSRLYALTRNLAKPAVPYGGKYRIIDFPLSNCVNSGIDTVGVLTQYQPLVLNEYIGNGQPWDLDRVNGGVYVLPPYQKSKGSDWYTGTANAIYQNIPFIERYDPDYVVILSGDHIYKMDYSKMLSYHKKNNADCTIAALEVPMEEAPRFGIMNCNEDMSIYEFEEKPPQPKSNLASMGIYIFSWKKLKKYLEEDEQDPSSSKDFGKNILPKMLADGQRMFAWPFDGYWKDVGTIDSLWEANMDLLDPKVPLELRDQSWKIYARNPIMPPHFVAKGAVVQDSMVTEGCKIEGTVDFSVLFAGVTVEQGAIVRDSIIMPGSVVKAGAVVEYAIVAEDCVIGEGAHVGKRPEEMEDKDAWGVAVIGAGVTIGDKVEVGPKAMVERDILEV
ncbi:glucose-1-phosphate adenylyltransferase [Zongyangia hominis]|uniref:Glucose-1-phosphate adenylyltransferase n=1 Tax=Zongyangia hominis TaxID=2763677 RepID=A0A926IC69_9FIRM|nr:glucose-1-phosphate adenylyltransferase [Zongyangia hominis]MBC8571038.1 glucose-1-phosphate adenylyltransferase [Zongyangia hominis]